MKKDYDLICVGMALVDSIIKGFDPKPVSASGYRAASGRVLRFSMFQNQSFR